MFYFDDGRTVDLGIPRGSQKKKVSLEIVPSKQDATGHWQRLVSNKSKPQKKEKVEKRREKKIPKAWAYEGTIKEFKNSSRLRMNACRRQPWGVLALPRGSLYSKASCF